jgi:glyoxylase-like metal-dependent hydrolase (beta-lactamase superfamily II)
MDARFDIITIGNLSRNRYWDESEETRVRPTLCTCTLIRGEGFRLLVDPSCPEPERMAAELDRRSGLKLSDIDAVFLTHEHGDHYWGLAHFPGAERWAAPAVAEAINAAGGQAKPVEGVTGPLFGVIELLPTPGHTPGHHSLRFQCDGRNVVVAGDAVMTHDFWRDRRPYFNAADMEQARLSLDSLAALADIIVPGHDNCFLV